MSYRAVAILTLACALSGCANRLEIEAQKSQTEGEAYCSSQRTLSGPMATRLIWQGESATPAQLSAGDFPSASDNASLMTFATALSSCMDRAVSWTAAYRPWRYPYANAAKTAIMNALADLMAGKNTYGGTNQRLAFIDAQLEIQYADADSHQAELNQLAAAQQQANFAAAMTNFQQGMQQLSPPAPAPAPSPATFPAYVPRNCRTVFTGNVANTQCY